MRDWNDEDNSGDYFGLGASRLSIFTLAMLLTMIVGIFIFNIVRNL